MSGEFGSLNNPRRSSNRATFICIALTLVTIATLSPLFRAQFADWDDNTNISRNPQLMDHSLGGLRNFWTHPYLGLYIPVTYSAWWGLLEMQPDAGASSLSARPFHGLNILVHAASVLVVFAIVRLVVPSEWAAGCGALLFAIHPLQVETVGWVSGLKDLLSGFFGFLAIWLYLIHANLPQVRRSKVFMAGTVALLLALLSKPSAIMIPFIAVAIAIMGLRQSPRKVIVELMPWFVLAGVTAIVARAIQPPPDLQYVAPLWARPLIAGDSLSFYLSKLLLPVRLVIDYARTPEYALLHFPYPAYWTWVFPAITLLFVIVNRRKWPFIFLAAVIFVLGLLPMLGLAAFSFQGYSTVADHYVYPAMLGPAVAVAGVLANVRRTILVAAMTTPIAAILGALSYQQAGTWLSDQTVFAHLFEVTPHNWLAANHLWLGAMLRQDYPSAEVEARRYIDDSPGDSMAWYDLGEALVFQNRRAEAIKAYSRAIDLNSQNGSAYSDLAAIYAEDGRYDLAISLFERALRLNPNSVEAQAGLARVRQEAATRTARGKSGK
jgi:hypothetical protein